MLEQTSTYDSDERIFLAIPMSDPKKHHYVPEFYLKGFCRHGKLWMYDRESGVLVQLRPETAGIAKSFYAFDVAKGKRDVSAERMLSRLENAAAPIIRKIEDRQRITLDEEFELVLFVGLMRYRVPDFKQEHKEYYLDSAYQERIISRSNQHLIPPWAIDQNEADKLQCAAILEDYPGKPNLEETEKIIRDLLDALTWAGIVEMVTQPKGGSDGEVEVPGFQVQASAMRWIAGDGTEPFHDPIRTPDRSEAGGTNRFFVVYPYRFIRNAQRV